MSGYEKSPDYGGPKPLGGGWIAAVAFFAAVSAIAIWLA